MTRILHLIARQSRLILVMGLLAGLLLPSVAQMVRPYLPHLVALLLCITGFRVGVSQAVGGVAMLRQTLSIVLVLQLALPLVALVVFTWANLAATPFALAVVLMLSAPSVTGAPNFAIMNGHDPAPAMRVLVLGTALFPFTVIPVLWLLPELGQGDEAVRAGLRLIAVILGAVGLGFLLRAFVWRHPRQDQLHSLDGINSIALAVVVVGLMSALGPLIKQDVSLFLMWLAGVVAVNFGLQLVTFAVMHRMGRTDAVGVSVIAGNRNIALFLIALPAVTMDPLLIFIGCYQVPMYLTPLLLKRLHDHAS